MKKSLPIIILLALILVTVGLIVRYHYTDSSGNFILFEKGLNVYQLKSGEVPAVTDYLKQNLNDLKSYEPLEWGTLEEVAKDDRGKPIYIIRHRFRAANGFGAQRISDLYFELNYLGFVNKTMTPSEYYDYRPGK